MIKSIKKVVRKVSKIVAYIPVLWKDDDYCMEDMAKLIIFKANRMENGIRTSKFQHENTERYCSEIKEFTNSLNSYLNPTTFDDYSAWEISMMPVKTLRELNQKEWDEIESHWNKAWDIIKSKGYDWAD